jgi:hypothetical protein
MHLKLRSYIKGRTEMRDWKQGYEENIWTKEKEEEEGEENRITETFIIELLTKYHFDSWGM